ncbi:MAG: ribonuclease P protein component [Candidatus Falkowbacteria bacterium]|nr:ribonuclease P protein component [Candidatus Falkowbacteria bacterium]
MLTAKNRLKKTKEFDRVFKGGRSYYSEVLGLKVKDNSLTFNRFGFIIGLKLSKKAVVRNKLKRQVREIVKGQLNLLKPGFDCVFVFFPLILDKEFEEIKDAVIKSLKRVNLYF